MSDYAIGIDIGGTNMRVALINQSLEIINREVASTRAFKTKEQFFQTLGEMVETVNRQNLAKVIGFVMPAPWHQDMDQILDITNVPYLEHVSLIELKSYFIEYEVYIENDVNVIALLECDKGCAKQYRHLMYITVSSGIGSGMIINSQIYNGAHGYSGEIGAIVISRNQALSNGGTLEELCSGIALEEKSVQLFGADATPELLFQKYRQHNGVAHAFVTNWLDDLATGLAAGIQVMDPEVVVLGGPVILKNEWLVECLNVAIKSKLFGSLSEKLKIKVAKYGTDAGIIGAGYFAFKQLEGEI